MRHPERHVKILHALATVTLEELEVNRIRSEVRRQAVKLFCTWCGIELDADDVDANVATWGVFKMVCSDCVEGTE